MEVVMRRNGRQTASYVLAALVLVVSYLFVPARAFADDCGAQAVPSCSIPASNVSAYSGRGVVASPQTVGAWQWTANGWIAATLQGGEPVYIAPFGGGWTWVWSYRLAAWRAVRSNRVGIAVSDLFPSYAGYTRPYFEVGTPAGAYFESAPRGVMIVVHGGGFYGDSPTRVIGMRDSANRWRDRGWLTVNVDYRTGTPSFVDVVGFYDAIRASVGKDTKICSTGDSAGGTLSLMLAVYRPELACVISNAGPSNLSVLTPNIMQLCAINGMSTLGLLQFSPITYAASIRAKVLLATGANDVFVPVTLQDAVLARARPDFMHLVLATPGGVPFVHTGVTPEAYADLLSREALFADSVLTL